MCKDRLVSFLTPPSPCYDRFKKERMRDFLKHFNSDQTVLDIGCRQFVLSFNHINLDIALYPGVNLIGDAHKLPLKSARIDGIIIIAVLEHVVSPDLVVEEMYRVLKPGGRIYVEVPFLQGYHPDPIDHQRYTKDGLAKVLNKFRIIDSGIGGGPSSTLCWVLRVYVASFFNTNFLFLFFKFLFGWLTSPLKYLDFFLINKKRAHILASGFYFIGEKR